MTIRENIKNIREDANITLRELAKLSDLSYEYLYKMEKGEFDNPGVETIRKIAIALNVSLTDLIPDSQ